MKRSSRVVLASPGLSRNSNGFLRDKPLYKFFIDNLNRNAREIIDETFFQLKKDSEKEFLDYDTSIMVMEVDENVILQV